AVRGMLEQSERGDIDADARAALAAALLAGLATAREQLVTARDGEGARLHEVLAGQLDMIGDLTAQAAARAAAQPDLLRQRMDEQLAQLRDAAAPVGEERLAQELALLATKADVREELDRLAAHIAAGRALMAERAPVGRRLDFLCQEFNREANTLCSKAVDLELTRLGLELKTRIEQFREQVQNVE
ncbi:MAG: endoribonuclease YicC domain-containing protein, partial [Thalassobaculaceae bacterium]